MRLLGLGFLLALGALGVTVSGGGLSGSGSVSAGSGSITATFVLESAQGGGNGDGTPSTDVCVSPCVVRVDAQATTDTDTARPFHDLGYRWDFGDSGNSCGFSTWDHSGLPTNTDNGPISGHVFCHESGGTQEFTVTLTVYAEDGDTASTTRTITVTDPEDYFADADIFCIANTAGTFQGCPHDTDSDGTCEVEDNCAVTSSFDVALEGGDNCNGTQDCGDVENSQQWVLLATGDSFALSGFGASLNRNATTTGLVSSFGAGARPIVTHSGSTPFNCGDKWVIDGLAFSGSGTTANTIWLCNIQDDAPSDYTIYNSTSTGHDQSCINEAIGNPNAQPLRHAYVRNDCDGSGDDQGLGWSDNWMLSGSLVLMGNRFDSNRGGEYPGRFIHYADSVISHNYFLGSGGADTGAGSRGPLQLRGCSPSESCDGSYDATNDHVVVAHNRLQHINDSTGFMMRVCGQSGCDAEPSAWNEMEDYIFDGNFTYCIDGTTPATSGTVTWLHLFGGDHTVRNNVMDARGCFPGGTGTGIVLVAASGLGLGTGPTNDDDVHVYNNTIWTDETVTKNIILCSNPASGTSHECYNNWFYGVGSGSFTAAESGYANADNVDLGTDPLVSTPAAQGSTDLSDFRIGAGASSLVDQGTAKAVFFDAEDGCRVSGCGGDGSIDIGADEN